MKQEQHRSTAKQRGKDALLSSSTGRKQVEVEILEMTEEIEAKLKIKTSGTREAECRTGYGSSGDILQGHDALSEKESKEEKSATEKGLEEAEKLREESPWNLRRFQREPQHHTPFSEDFGMCSSAGASKDCRYAIFFLSKLRCVEHTSSCWAVQPAGISVPPPQARATTIVR